MVATYSRPTTIFTKADCSHLWDLENRRYIDFTAGIAVNALGHNDEVFLSVMAEQVPLPSFSPSSFKTSTHID